MAKMIIASRFLFSAGQNGRYHIGYRTDGYFHSRLPIIRAPAIRERIGNDGLSVR
jgi:hypothetical protein